MTTSIAIFCCFENEKKNSCVLCRNFISIYKIKGTFHGRLGIRIFSSRAESISHSFASLTREILSALEGKIRIPKRPCNVRFSRPIFWSDRFSYFLYDLLSDFSSEFLSISCPFFCPFFFRFLVLIFVRFFVLFFVRTLDTAHRTSRSDIGHQTSDIIHRTVNIGHQT